jgi:hypothetical protein
VPGTRGNEDGVAGIDDLSGAIDFHFGGAFEDEVEFLAEAMVVAFGGAAGAEGGFGEGLVLDGGVGEVEKASNRGAVFGREGRLMGEGADDHGVGRMTVVGEGCKVRAWDDEMRREKMKTERNTS